MSKIARPYDYLYDGNYTVSSYNDHVKAMIKSQTHDVIINPVYDNMFSALRHFPPSHYQLRAHRLPELGHDRTMHRGDPQVVGMNRYKYFRRPIIPYQPSLGGQVVYARKPAPAVEVMIERPVTPPTRTVGMQTVYRESEAQTDPYSPEYTLKPGQMPPELLALATLSYGMGLPVGMVELEMIERARIKRAWEAMLPQVVDKETFERRLKMMEEMELKEWQERENEIKRYTECARLEPLFHIKSLKSTKSLWYNRLQEARLEILTQVISKREKDNEQLNNEKVERIWQKKLQEREAMLDKIESKRVKALRKLTEKRSKIGNKIERRDIIADYANYGSKVYAPKARDGLFFDDMHSTLVLDIQEIEHYEGLTDLETTFQSKIMNDKVSLPKSKDLRLNPSARREMHLQEQLKLMDIKLKERKQATKAEEKPLRFQQRNEKPPLRPPTPKIKEPKAEDEDMDVAAILLQKLIRGRISQNLMYQGKERRLQLINELRTRHTIKRAIEFKQNMQGPEGSGSSSQEELDNALEGGKGGKGDRQQRKPRSRGYAEGGDEFSNEDGEFIEGEEFEVVLDDLDSPNWIEKLFESSVQAEFVGKTLDFLSKELVRLREERRISAMVRLAERTRQMREADETHNREVEMARRRKEDEVFRKVMRINQETVDSYLEDIVAGSIDSTASLQAKGHVKEFAEKVATLVQEMEKREKEIVEEVGEPETSTIVSDLVMSFLVPEVEREYIRNQIKQDQRKYLLAAHRTVYSEVSHVEDKLLLELMQKQARSKQASAQPEHDQESAQ
ncbi:UNVERIFIED_CONTAM: Cilia- and flagella-associated protein 91 [Siphonaria sp. JEL0065]|nr:Cilia- and flagella-associated protein 91 [Siphonaria sp. JEL0065]